MAQQFDYPKSETDLRVILDALYKSARTAREAGNRPAFKGLVELMSAQATIITAIHNIKSNKGSKTPGIDHKTMQKGYLQKPTAWVIQDIQAAFRHYEPQKIRRKYIDKPGKAEKRPLGIPTIRANGYPQKRPETCPVYMRSTSRKYPLFNTGISILE